MTFLESREQDCTPLFMLLKSPIPSPDPMLSLRDLALHAGLSVRTLRKYLEDPQHPLPCYRIGGRVLVRRSEFDAWVTRYRHCGRVDVAAIVADVFNGLSTRRKG